ncbi:MAG: Rrf2 family transcriptional regulator [Spirochaetota bacterium]
MKFSRSIEYAVHGLIFMAVSQPVGSVLLSDIARNTCIRASYLRKVFQILTKAGLVTAQRGAGGGYSLARDPGGISLKDIVLAIEGDLPLYNCLKLDRNCGISANCPVKRVFKHAQVEMFNVLDGKTIYDLAQELTVKGLEPQWIKTAVR